MLPKILYVADSYLSHRVAASAYLAALEQLGALTTSPNEADIVVYHCELRRLQTLRDRLPALRGCYAIGLLVWESDRLRERDEAAVRLLDEVWTPTLYSARPFVSVHRRVYALPHVVEVPEAPTADDLARVDAWFGHEPCINLLAVMKLHETRKNAKALISAVRHLRRQKPELRLIIKDPGSGLGGSVQVERRPGLLNLIGRVPKGVLEALFRRSQMVVSAHHAEGWGLSLSDALRRRVPVVASDYSGNRSFMPADGAFPVACDERLVGHRPDLWSFDAQSVWGAPRQQSLESQIMRALSDIESGAISRRIERGYRAVRRYDDKRLALLIKARLQDVAVRLSTYKNKDR